MQELRSFLNNVLDAKRHLKEIYYTTRNPDTKSDAKELVVWVITIQKSIESILEMQRKTRRVRKILNDRRAGMLLLKWSTGLSTRVKDFKEKYKSLRQEHLHRYQQTLIEYLETIATELAGWIQDIETLSELPRPPKD